HSLMYIVGATSTPTRVSLDLPRGWAIASGLETTRDPQTLAASSVELLLDSPIVVGQFRSWDFDVHGVQHHIVYLPQPNATAFDTWNLMHVRPVERVGVRYRPANATGELWWCEGVTIYFSDMLLRRAKLPVYDPTRIAHLQHNMEAYLLRPGYSRNSAERVSRA